MSSTLNPGRSGLLQKARKQKDVKICEWLQSKYRQDDGNVESALVLIPLLILFMIAIELIVATNLRNSEFALTQSDVSSRAISGQVHSSDEVIELDSPDPFTHMKLLISHRKRSLPQLVPGLFALMGGSTEVEVNGAAVMENLN